MMAGAVGAMAQHQDPSSRSLSSLPRASVPSLSSSISSPLWPPFARDPLPVVVSFSCSSSHSAVRLKHQRVGEESLLVAGLLFPLRLLWL